MATPSPAQLADSVPTGNESDAQLIAWMNQNGGRYIYDNQGQLVQVPTWIATQNNVQGIRTMFTSPQSTFTGATLSPLGTQSAAQAAAAGAGAGTSPSFTGNYANVPNYYGTGSGTGASMASSSPVISNGQVLYKPDGTAITPAQTAQIMSLFSQYQAGDMRAGAAASQLASSLGMGHLDEAVANLQNQTGPNAPPANAPQPETTALAQQAQIDPVSEALRNQLAASYAAPLSQSTSPSAADYQSYLTQFQQLDPEEYAQRQGLATSMDSYLQQAQAQNALGSQLDPVTARQVEQQTRLGQAARGNVYGTPQMVEEAMTTGQAGLALQQQRMQNLGTALGAQQSYLGSGLGLGDTALSLYQQNRTNLQNAQNSALNYLGSGQTPYQTGASYLNQANMNAANAAQGGPVYQPAALGASSQAAQIPQYGLDIGQQSQNWYNSLQAYNGGGLPTKNKGVAAATGAATGALSGAVGGATIGSSVPGLGTLAGAAIGAGAGALTGGAGGYFS